MREIKYRFILENGETEEFVVELDEVTADIQLEEKEEYPEWCRLSFRQCRNCPLKEDKSPYCPVAVVLQDMITPFERLLSFNKVKLEIELPERTIISNTSAQKAISSLMGLRIGASGCPRTAFFRPMARFHLPVSSLEETIYRAAGAYMLGQYFLDKRGEKFDQKLAGLKLVYEHIHTVNTSIADRIRAASKTDSTLNALIILDLFSHALPLAVDKSLDSVEPLFEDYFKSLKYD